MARQSSVRISLVTVVAIALITLIFQIGGTIAVASAGRFPDFIPITDGSPRGVAVDKVGNVYVSVGVGTGPSEHIFVQKYSPAGEPLFQSPVDIGQGTIGGLTVSANGDLYIALAAGTNKGVYRMGMDGQPELLPGSNQIFFANGLAFDDRGTLYVTETVSMTYGPGLGGIWRIPKGGQAEPCLHNVLLSGTGALGAGIPLGANGIVYYHGDLYVSNTEKGTVLKISIKKDGSLEAPELWATLQEVPDSFPPLSQYYPVVMGDGMTLDVFGNIYVAVLTRSAVIRINIEDPSEQQTVAVFPADLLNSPASLFFGTGKGERTNLFVTNLGMGPWPGRGLVKLDAGVPGRPLH
jgi:sugar lactone lactonase YvrE